MTNQQKTKDEGDFEKALDVALLLVQKGKPVQEILERFPQYREELQDLLNFAYTIEREKKGIVPPKDLVSRVLSLAKIPDVTETPADRFFRRGYGRTSITSPFENRNAIMSPMKFFLPAGALAVLVIAVLIIGGSRMGKPVALNLKEVAEEAGALDEFVQEFDGFVSEETKDVQEIELGAAEGGSGIAGQDASTAAGVPGTPSEVLLSGKAASQAEDRELNDEFSEMDGFFSDESSFGRTMSE